MELTEEQKKDVQGRTESFKKDYDDLCSKYQVEVVSGPVLTTIGPNLFATTMVMNIRDTKYLPTPSPLTGNELSQ